MGDLAVVLGTGGIGQALADGLRDSGRFAEVLAFGRQTAPALDVTDEVSVAAVAAEVKTRLDETGRRLTQLWVATGFLHGAAGQPERSWAQLDPAYLQQVLAVNTVGPALVIKHFFPLLPRSGPCAAAFLSAKVGSIGDNALGGWYGYRASKAALNQLVKTAAIELARRNREALCVALHPGTVATALSAPFAKQGLQVRPPAEAAARLRAVVDGLGPAYSGGFFSHDGQPLPW